MSRGWRAALCVAGLVAACASQLENRHGDSLDVSMYPPDVQAAYEVFAVRCSRCHSLARPFGARITDEQHWVRYVARMRRHPGSGINKKNGEIILKFLLFYTAEVRRQEAGLSAGDESVTGAPPQPVTSTANGFNSGGPEPEPGSKPKSGPDAPSDSELPLEATPSSVDSVDDTPPALPPATLEDERRVP